MSEPKGRVFVTGGSGFVGSAVYRRIARAGLHRQRPLTSRRDLTSGRRQRSAPSRAVSSPPGALDEGMGGCDAVIHLVGIIREIPRTRHHLRAHACRWHAERRRRRQSGRHSRYVHMSALARGRRAPAATTEPSTRPKNTSAPARSDGRSSAPRSSTAPAASSSRWKRLGPRKGPAVPVHALLRRGRLGRGGAGSSSRCT